MPSVSDRNVRLDTLVTTTVEWAKKSQDSITQRVLTSTRVLKGRTGGERLAKTAVDTAASLVIRDLEEFLLPT